MSRLLHILVLAGAAPLIMPPGWCCAWQAPPRADSQKAAANKSCCGCKKCSREQTPTGQKPNTPPTNSCPCTDRSATAPEVNKDGKILIAAATLPLAISVSGMACEPLEGVDGPIAHHHISRQVLNCTWRC